jgi:hypothetical protein
MIRSNVICLVKCILYFFKKVIINKVKPIYLIHFHFIKYFHLYNLIINLQHTIVFSFMIRASNPILNYLFKLLHNPNHFHFILPSKYSNHLHIILLNSSSFHNHFDHHPVSFDYLPNLLYHILLLNLKFLVVQQVPLQLLYLHPHHHQNITVTPRLPHHLLLNHLFPNPLLLRLCFFDRFILLQ